MLHDTWVVDGEVRTVYAIVPDGAGGLFVAGDFLGVGGGARRNLAHLVSPRTGGLVTFSTTTGALV